MANWVISTVEWCPAVISLLTAQNKLNELNTTWNRIIIQPHGQKQHTFHPLVYHSINKLIWQTSRQFVKKQNTSTELLLKEKITFWGKNICTYYCILYVKIIKKYCKAETFITFKTEFAANAVPTTSVLYCSAREIKYWIRSLKSVLNKTMFRQMTELLSQKPG